MPEKVVVSWSGGKDSALALYKILKDDQYKVDSLLTTITEGYQRISIHGVKESLLDEQAEKMGIPLRKMYIPQQSSNEIYQGKMDEQLQQIKSDGVHTIVFGDIFLEDVRSYREGLVKQEGLDAIFPLWGRATEDIINDFMSLGSKTITTCIDTEQLSDSFLGREIDNTFLEELPDDADPCGEKGEFHTFTYAGPIFKQKISVTVGEQVDQGRFHFCELN